MYSELRSESMLWKQILAIRKPKAPVTAETRMDHGGVSEHACFACVQRRPRGRREGGAGECWPHNFAQAAGVRLIVRAMSGIFWNTATRYIATKLNWVTTQIPPPPRAPDDTAPRKLLLVHCHPIGDSFSSALAEAVVAGAKEGGHDLRRRSLYSEKFQPALTAKERGVYMDAAAGASRLSSDVRGHIADLRWCDSIVFVYPTWWFNLPAMLKGYFDRTFVPGADCVWDFPKQQPGEVVASNGLVPRLTNVKRIMGVSTYGASRRITLLAGDNGRNCIGTAIRSNFHPDCTCHWLALYDLDFVEKREREAFLETVKCTVRDEF